MKGSDMTVTQQLVDHIVARAQNSAMGLSDPKSSYDLKQYSEATFETLAMLLVTAHVEKYDLISIFAAALEEVADESFAEGRTG